MDITTEARPTRSTSWVPLAFMVACALGISIGVTAIMGMLLAALAFSQTTTIVVPFIATFHGFLDTTGTHAVTVTGSWAAAGVVAMVVAAALSALAARRWR
ncbi:MULTISPECIES: hypothetical protein [Plantibacter]|uniref:hypothetical protein n=1 Tax=Plantibacter TaxID=190323 RepID=UPI0017856BCF|nr:MULTISPECIES: hypothetical protein [Plantibacter]MBD8101531.1 hypothetical protein [Plantibacter sp. CFBP 8775]CAH0230336.1 hypothetical protein SRABI02_02672 [Plantibacter cousiniae]